MWISEIHAACIAVLLFWMLILFGHWNAASWSSAPRWHTIQRQLPWWYWIVLILAIAYIILYNLNT